MTPRYLPREHGLVQAAGVRVGGECHARLGAERPASLTEHAMQTVIDGQLPGEGGREGGREG